MTKMTNEEIATEIISHLPEVDQGNKTIKGKIFTNNGTPIYWKLIYDKGGYNPFSLEPEPRAFEVELCRQLGEQAFFKDLDEDTAGCTRIVIREVGRFSKKQEKLALQEVAEKLPTSLANNYPNL